MYERGDEFDGLVEGTEAEGCQHRDGQQRAPARGRVDVSDDEFPDHEGSDDGAERMSEVVELGDFGAERCVIEDPVADSDQPTAEVHDRGSGARPDDRFGDRSGSDDQNQGDQQDDGDHVLPGARYIVDDAVHDEPDQHEREDDQGTPFVRRKWRSLSGWGRGC